jgi:hypothetical protein
VSERGRERAGARHDTVPGPDALGGLPSGYDTVHTKVMDVL